MKNIRSYVDQAVEFPEGSLLLAGDVGAGKSTMLLALEFALFGLRNVSGSELLRHGTKSGSVELLFELDQKSVRVRRTLKRSKSIVQDAGSLEIGGSTEELMPTELTARVKELFGYPKESKESIFRYTVYAPQEEMKHILHATAEERLKILRRIFGIEKYGVMAENTKIIGRECRSLVREYAARIADLPVREAELREKQQVLESTRKEKEKVAKQLEETSRLLGACRTALEEAEQKESEAMALRQRLASWQAEEAAKRRNLETVEMRVASLRERLDAYTREEQQLGAAQPPARQLQDIRQELSQLDAQRTALVSTAALLENDRGKLSGILEKGRCEVCGQPVHDRESFRSGVEKKSAEHAAALADAIALKEKIDKLVKEQDAAVAYTSIAERKRGVQRQIVDASADMNRLVEEKRALEQSLATLRSQNAELSARLAAHAESSMSQLKQQRDQLLAEQLTQERHLARLEQQLADVSQRTSVLENEVREKKRIGERVAYLGALDQWLDGVFVSLLGTIEKQVMIIIQKEFDDYFRSWFSIIMGEEALSVRIDESFSPLIEQNGFETAYENLSGGEKTAVALAYRLSLNKVINSLIENIKTKDMLVLDEPTDGFSSSQIDRIRYVIDELGLRQVVLVSHEPKIDTFVDHVIRVYKQDHVTHIA